MVSLARYDMSFVVLKAREAEYPARKLAAATNLGDTLL